MGQAKQRKLSDPNYGASVPGGCIRPGQLAKNYGKLHAGQSPKRSDNLRAKKPVVVRTSKEDVLLALSIALATVAAEKLHELDPGKDVESWGDWVAKEATELLKAEAPGEITSWISNL